MSRRAPTATRRPPRDDETDAPLVPDIAGRTRHTETTTDDTSGIGRTDRSDRTDRTDTTDRRRRRDPFELTLMEDSE